MDIQSIIATRRDGLRHTRQELVALATGAGELVRIEAIWNGGLVGAGRP